MNLFNFRTVIVLAAAIAALAWWMHAHQSAAPVDTRMLTGRAVDVHGRGVPGAEVLIRSESGRFVAQTRTSEDGQFSIGGCEPGSYCVIVIKDGVGGGERSVVIREGHDADALIALAGIVKQRS